MFHWDIVCLCGSGGRLVEMNRLSFATFFMGLGFVGSIVSGTVTWMGIEAKHLLKFPDNAFNFTMPRITMWQEMR